MSLKWTFLMLVAAIALVGGIPFLGALEAETLSPAKPQLPEDWPPESTAEGDVPADRSSSEEAPLTPEEWQAKTGATKGLTLLMGDLASSPWLPEHLRGSGRISGTVLDAKTGEGIAGASVHCRSEGGGLFAFSKSSDSRGRYKLEGLPPGTYMLWIAEPPEYPDPDWSEEWAIMLAEGQKRDDVDFALSPGFAVRGRVVDAAGQGVPEAHVTCSFGGVREQYTQADAQGRFVLEAVWAEKEVTFLASKDELVSESPALVDVSEGDVEGTTLLLVQGASILGRVADADGQGLKGIHVVAAPVGLDEREAREARSEANGEFELIGLGAGEYKLGANDGREFFLDTADWPFEGDPPKVDFGDPKSMLHFLKDGAKRAAEESGEPFTEEKAAKMEREFEEQIAEGAFRFRFGRVEKALLAQTLGVGESVNGLVLVCAGFDDEGWAYGADATKTIAGKVIDAEGRPVKGAHVDAKGADGSRGSGESDGQGSFRIVGLRSDTYELSASGGGFVRVSLEGVPSGTKDLEIPLEAYGGVRGVAVDEVDGKPVTQFRVGIKEGLPSGRGLWATYDPNDEEPDSDWAHDLNRPHQFQEVSDPGGRFHLRNVSPGPHTVFVEAEGYRLGKLAVEMVHSGETVEVVVPSPPALTLSGRVLDTAGQPVAGAAISIGHAIRSDDGPSDPGAVSPIQTGAKGEFVLTDWVGDDMSVFACHPDFASGSASIRDIQSGNAIVLVADATLEGAVTLDGEALPGVRVLVHYGDLGNILNRDRKRDRSMLHVVTGTAGRYRVRHVPPGEVRVSVMARVSGKGVYLCAEKGVALGGGTQTIDLELSEGASMDEASMEERFLRELDPIRPTINP